MTLPIIVLLPFIAAPFAAYFAQYNRTTPAWVAGATVILALSCLSSVISDVFSDQTLIQSWQWLPAIGLNFAFRIDGLALLFALLILLIGLLIIIYARYYLTSKDSTGRFYAYLLMFMGSMLGIVLSENLIQLVIFWELTSLTSFLLISFWQYRQDARRGARMALAITGAGGLALLGGVLILGHIVGSYQLTDVLANGDLIRNHTLYLPMLILVLLGIFTKSAQFPFHFWLPHAMAAPTPVSAYLHSATMVKAGIFLLARLFPALSGTSEWFWLVTTAGLFTLIIGAYTALFKTDLKGLLAYSTISHLGLITVLFGFSSQLAVVVALFHILNHATFKGALFMVSGIIDHETGTRDLNQLRGLFKWMPYTGTLAMIAAAAMAGVPLFNGFLSKEMFFEQTLLSSENPLLVGVIAITVTFAAAFSVAYSLRFVHNVFFNGQPTDLPKIPHEPPRMMQLPVIILTVLCLAVGIMPMLLVGPLLNIATTATLQVDSPAFNIALWHGFNLPLLMSVIAFIVGIWAYSQRQQFNRLHPEKLFGIDGKRSFEHILLKMDRFASRLTQRFDQGRLQPMLIWILLTAIVLSVYGFINFSGAIIGNREFMPLDIVTVTVALVLMLSSVLTVALHRQRLIALFPLGTVGLICALGFVRFSAPDLALTQLSVEVVTIVLLLLALFFLPQITPKEHNHARLIRDGLIAVLAAAAVFILTLSVLSREYSTIADYFLANAKPGGGGTNVVNVILVDFRGFDTLGEISVLALAGLGVFALLKGLKLDMPTHNSQGIAWVKNPHTPLFQTLIRSLFPLMLMVAVFIFLRGHNLPGGGFISGLIAAVALIAQYLANGIAWSNERIRFDIHYVIAAGLLIAVITGLVSIIIGYPFLTSAFTYLDWPIVGKFEIASAMAFDLGVFLVVVSAAVLILVELGKLSHRATPITYQEPK